MQAQQTSRQMQALKLAVQKITDSELLLEYIEQYMGNRWSLLYD